MWRKHSAWRTGNTSGIHCAILGGDKGERLGVYHEDTMVGFILYDFDDTIPGWSMSRFMIGKQYQGKGYSKQAVVAFLDYFKKKHNADRLYISVSLDNAIARRMYYDLSFEEIKEVAYSFSGRQFREMQMVKKL